MRKVNLRMNEQHKYDIIKKLVDSNGNKKNAALKGIPAKFLTDRRTVFEYTRKNVSSDEEDTEYLN